MAKDLPIRVTFVYDRSVHKSQQDYEVNKTRALSHSARVSHQRRRLLKKSLSTVRRSDSSSDSDSSSTDESSSESVKTLTLPKVRYLNSLVNVPHPRVASFYRGMDIWFQWVMPNAAPAFRIFNVDTSVFSTYFSSPGRQSEAVQHSLAALGYCCLEYHRQESNIWECDYKQEQLKHNGTAIALLKKEVHASAESKINRASLVHTIFLLSFLAHFRGDMQESILHRKALRTLLRSSVKQDRAEFDKSFGPLLLQFFCWMNVLEGQPNVLGIFPEDGQDHAVLSSDFDRSYLDQKSYDVDIDLPKGFQKLVTKGLISKDTRRLLARFAYGCEYGVDAVPQPEKAFPDFAVATPYLTAAEPTFEKCLVLAIFCYAHMRWASAPNLSAGILCHNISRTQLSQALHRVPKTDDTVECLVWIWIVLIETHRVEKLGFSSSGGGISCLGEFKLNFPEWDDWDRIERDILPQFFWRDGDSVAIKHAWNRYPVGVLDDVNCLWYLYTTQVV